MSCDDKNSVECIYCYDKVCMKEFGCKTCKSSLCSDCFYRIARDAVDMDKKQMEMSFKCPVCRSADILTYDDFDKDAIVSLANFHTYELTACNNIQELEKLKGELKEVRQTSEVRQSVIIKQLTNEKSLKDKIKQMGEDIENLSQKLKNKDENHRRQIEFFQNCVDLQTANLRNICEGSKTKAIKICKLKPLYECGNIEVSFKI